MVTFLGDVLKATAFSSMRSMLVIALGTVAFGLVGCKQQATVEPKTLGSCELYDYLDVTISLEPSSSQVVVGDMRPLWVAAGRTTNKSGLSLRTVVIHLVAKKIDSEEILDTADF